MNINERAEILSEALPYIQKFRGKTVVVKYGGAAMASEELKRAVISDIVLLSLASIGVVVVHGGGPEINQTLKSMDIEPKFSNGLRVTDDATMDVVQMVLAGKIGKDLAALIGEMGGRAVSLCGLDGGMFTAARINDDLGRVGEIKKIDAELIKMTLNAGYIPVVSSIAGSPDGSLNINADTAASALAVALGAEKLMLLTDVKGIMTDPDDDATFIPRLNLSELTPLIRQGLIKGGMIPKIECCIDALRRGVARAHILDGRMTHAILLELLSRNGVGTMIVNS